MIDTACHEKKGCWIGRADALILWRNAPPDRLLVHTGDEFATPVLDANQLDSTAAAGPRRRCTAPVSGRVTTAVPLSKTMLWGVTNRGEVTFMETYSSQQY